MKQIKTMTIASAAAIAALCLLTPKTWGMKDPAHRTVDTSKYVSIQRTPSPSTLDQITHNVGNIVTTVDNYGYIGGYRSYGLPSGEWPRNSGHDYIGEVKYWMGGVTPDGDTLVDNTNDEFQGVASIISSAEEYKILLSTDSTRYFNYDRLDTIGLGQGNPAFGWEIWSADSNEYCHTLNYNPIESTYFSGGPAAKQVSNFRFNDAAALGARMGIEVTHTVLQWNLCYNEDFTFVILDITNTSETDYHDFAFGLYIDLDVGGFDGTGENGRLGDVVAYDTTENLAWTYDQDGYDPGWGATVQAGIMGTKLLETPDNIGMTALRTGEWEQVPSDRPVDDIARYKLISEAAYDEVLPPADQYYIQCTRGINLTAHKTVRVVYAIVAGQTESEFRANAARAQVLYNAHYIGPQPPATPTLNVMAGNRKAYLNWNDTAETSIDPLSGLQDFAGYKLYRSDNQGKTWGTVNYQTGNSCMTTDYTPVTTFRVEDAGDPIVRSYIDTGLHNDVEYWYCLVAFDKGDSTVPVDALQSGYGEPGTTSNVVRVLPEPDPAGFYEAAATVQHDYIGTESPSEGSVVPIVFDRDSLKGADYRVSFEDTPARTYWHLINETTGDTVLARQRKVTGDPGLYEVVEGLRVVVRDADRVPTGYRQSAHTGADSTLVMGEFLGPAVPYFTGNSANAYGNQHFRSTYELRYEGDSTTAPSVIEYWIPAGQYRIPFEIWNTSTNERVSAAVWDADEDGVWTPADPIAIVNYPYDSTADLTSEAFPYYYGWMFVFDPSSYAPVVGDVYTVAGAPMNGPEDAFTFRVNGVSAEQASRDLSKIRVVPDPYFASYSSYVETEQGQSVITFHHIPDRCTIRIYTLAGDLVRTLEHTDGTGSERWNLQSSDNQQVASGVYLYHVESPYGERLGRFAIIK